ncbi:neutral/alkaline non-lysosomal ceramidase N-terminal domain-containing protein [bacterium]|nr:neutral/alkaline non-lysosomal ceramidase N-terminal domain-containing protein [bacterium]
MCEINNCKVGVAQIDITPPLGTELDGYFQRRVAKEIKSRLYTKSMIIEAGGKYIVFVVSDVCWTPEHIVAKAKKRIEKACGIPAGAVIISSTHTHTAPVIDTVKGMPYSADPKYVQEFTDNLVKSVVDAYNSMFEAEIYQGKTDAEGFSIYKLCRLKTGQDVYDIRPMDGSKDGRIGFSGELDNSVQVLCVKDKNKEVKAFAVNYACHPNSGPEVFWAEWPGDIAKTIASVYGSDVPCLFLQGTAGDVDCMPKLPHEQIGRGIAGAAIMAVERAINPIKVLPIDWRLRYIPIPRAVKDSESDKFIDSLRRNPKIGEMEKVWIDLYDSWNPEPKERQVPVQCLRLGDTAIVALKGEIFTPLGLEIKKFSPTPNTLVLELTDEKEGGYVPSVSQARRGGYGEIPFICRQLAPEAADMMTNSAIEMLWEMWDVTS